MRHLKLFDRCNATELIKLLEEDANFHVGRKLPDTEVSNTNIIYKYLNQNLYMSQITQQILM